MRRYSVSYACRYNLLCAIASSSHCLAASLLATLHLASPHGARYPPTSWVSGLAAMHSGRGVYPPNTLEQGPPSPSPSPSLSPPLPSPFPPFPSPPSPPLRSRPPLLRLGGLGERQTVFGEFQAINLASSNNDLQELFRK